MDENDLHHPDPRLLEEVGDLNPCDLPLLELFTKLREAGLPLGIDEYQLVLKSLQGGFGISDNAALKRLCQTLWVKSAEEKLIFEYQFKQLIGSEAISLTPETQFGQHQNKISQIARYVILGILGIGIALSFKLSSHEQTQTTQQKPTLSPTTNIGQETANQTIVQPTATPSPNTNTNQSNWIFGSLLSVIVLSAGYITFRTVTKRKTEQSLIENTSIPHLSPELTQIIEDEVQVAQAVRQVTTRSEEIPQISFILSTEYFPVTERQMKQIWRYLRRPVREGAATELDVEATVNQIGCQGLLLHPVLVAPRVNRAEMLLLIDQDGSMVPFHALSRRLAETALRGGRLGNAGIYYFHNCPIDYLYRDPYHQEAVLVSDIVNHICSERTAVLIFSDAGAARGGLNEERYDLTKEFLGKLKQRVRYIAWLNPMPKKRWFGTTAYEIARLVPMFEVSRRGLQDAIGVLRGRPTNFDGRKI
ncbi:MULTISPECIES: hypothetical protein [Nostocales]|uniref:hypothetical protein n=1 Tax=Nostocales TaxID=1161 RepID=UPI0004BBE4E4|nr:MULTISPECIES: hypothetical protein [Nostocales]